jgi:hypothetical protein
MAEQTKAPDQKKSDRPEELRDQQLDQSAGGAATLKPAEPVNRPKA